MLQAVIAGYRSTQYTTNSSMWRRDRVWRVGHVTSWLDSSLPLLHV